MKSLFEKLRAGIESLPFCCDKCLTSLSLSSGLSPDLNSSIPKDFATRSAVVEWSPVNINTRIPACSFRDLTTAAAFSRNWSSKWNRVTWAIE